MAQQSSMSFVLALVPQSHRSDTRGPGRCHASRGAVSQTAHTELFIASGKQACTWTTADTTLEVGQVESTQEPHLDKPPENMQECPHPWQRAPAGTPRAHTSSPAKTTMPPGVNRDNRTSHLRIQILKSDITEYKIRMPETQVKGTKPEQAQDKSGLGDMDKNQSELLEMSAVVGSCCME